MNVAMKIVEQVDEGAMFLAWAEAEGDSIRKQGFPLGESPTPEEAREGLEFIRGTRDAERGMFVGWPDDIAWFRAVATVEEIGGYQHCGYWTFRLLTNDSRLPRDTADAIANNTPTSHDHHSEVVALRATVPKIVTAVRDGHRPKPLIAVAPNNSGQVVIAEGNKRSIAYQSALPSGEEIEILFGTSPNIANWQFYGVA